MSQWIHAVIVDPAALEEVIGSEDSDRWADLVVDGEDELVNRDRQVLELDEEEGRNGDDEEGDCTDPTGAALSDIIWAAWNRKRSPLAYYHAFQFLCEAVADERLTNNELSPCGSWLSSDSDGVFKRAGIDFSMSSLLFNGTYGKVKAIEQLVLRRCDQLCSMVDPGTVTKTAATLRDFLDTAPPFEPEWGRTQIAVVAEWLERAAARNRAVIFWYE